MSEKQIKTKKGAAAVYVVIFTATLLGVISLSFVRLMLSEMGRTGNYSLSQSAYNSALAGIEDAKIVLLRYQNCVNNGGTYSGIACDEYIKQLQTNVEESSQNCDLVSELLGYNNDNHETIIQTKSEESEGVNINNAISDAASSFDQAYTCVRISPKNSDYVTTLTENYPTKIIPIRTSSASETNKVNRIVLSWFSRQNLESLSENGLDDTRFHIFNGTEAPMNGKMKGDMINEFQTASVYANSFNENPVVPSVIQATLIQTSNNFKLSEFYSAKGEKTNRGTITLRPTNENPYDIEYENNYSNPINGNPFASSAKKSQNSPLDVHCFINNDNDIPVSSGYACTADIFVPRPIGGDEDQRNYTTFFLVVNLPYGDPETDVRVELMNCSDENVSIFEKTDDAGCKNIDFADVQPIVDSTGRANDLFRRIEARIELVDVYFPIANYALAVDKTKDGEGDVNKDFYVTKNCEYEEWTWENGSVKHNRDTCPNSGYRD